MFSRLMKMSQANLNRESAHPTRLIKKPVDAQPVEHLPEALTNNNGHGRAALHEAQLPNASSLVPTGLTQADLREAVRLAAAPRVLCESAERRRPAVRGKFLFAGDRKLYVRGVTYGAFRPDERGNEYHDLDTIERDFAQMAANGFNAVRIPHTMPPRTLLDAAERHGLWVMVGLSAEQYLGFIIDKRRDVIPERVVRERVRQCAGHPALLAYSLGNEIPTQMVRWYGHRRVERYLEQLYWAIKEEDNEGLVTYVNYPSTEYLELPFLDLICFNVYLEKQEALEAYLARLQNIAENRPVILSEIGLDALRNGELAQARSLDWQIRSAFAGGCAGAFVFAWTDEWHRAGEQVEDWAFGITDRNRRPKPALGAVREAFADAPFADISWPRISVVVCTYNGSRTIRDCLEGLALVDYPMFEVIVVDDGSTDGTADIVREYDVRLIRTDNRGLSNARNTGLHAATGEIIAYLDDDARPEVHWLKYLAATFATTTHAGVGGPNIPPPDDGPIADCVANAPGGPVHVLLSDSEAEHIPGCNMAFRKECLEAIGGFDPQFRVAGDDVDICWRLQECGWTLGFHPAAVVWHHRRNSLRTYWKQQCGYGKAEALLKKKWPEKYTGTGQLSWAGRIYSRSLTRALDFRRGRIYHGMWGAAPFQRLYQPAPHALYSLSLIPEWYLAIPVLAVLSSLGMWWRPLLLLIPLLVFTTITPVAQGWLSTYCVVFPSALPFRSAPLRRFGLRLLTALLHVVHPVARLCGRLNGRSSCTQSQGVRPSLPVPGAVSRWTERGDSPDARLRRVEQMLRALGSTVRRGGDWDRWDLEVTCGTLGTARLIMAVEDHGAGNQFVRVRWWPSISATTLALATAATALSAAAVFDGSWAPAVVLGGAAVGLVVRAAWQCGAAVAAIERTVREQVGAR
jgi:O-antigen biosynthesis protein